MSEFISWKVYTIDDCCEILDNKRVPINSTSRELRKGDIPYYGANGLQGFIDDYIFDEPLILIAEDGGNFESFATRPIAYRISQKSWVNNHAHVLRAKRGFSQDLIFYSLEHKDIQSFIVGGTRAKLNQRALRSITISLPKYEPEQAKIAEVLSTVDRAIEQTEEMIAKQKRVKAGLMQNLLTRGIDEQGNLRSGETHKFKDSPLGRIPEEWEIKTLSELAVVERGKFTHRPRNDPRFYDGDFPFIQTGDVSLNIGRFITSFSQTLNKAGTKVSKRFEPGTIAITIAANIADTAILGLPMYFPDSIVGAVALHENDTRYLELMIRRWKPTLQSLAPQSAQKNINLETLKPLLIPTPTIHEQKIIGKLYEDFDKELLNNECYFKKLGSLKTALMRDLLTGKVRVTPLLQNGEVSV
ncbi:MAG: restriction endonuclease subunit S [Candidatus Riflebacteria bacterium]|nr:restriction endonuclease subunit S [Candidatus Riflebacteria bacterium]